MVALLTVAATAGSSGSTLDHFSDGTCQSASAQAFLASLRDLPAGAGWRCGGAGFSGLTRLGSFPPITEGPAELVFAAVHAEEEASLLVLRLPEGIRADQQTRDALAVASPSVFADVWGATFRTTRADLGRPDGRRLIRLHGTIATTSGDKAALTVWAPSVSGHHVVMAITRMEAAVAAAAVADALVSRLPQENPTGAPESRARLVLAIGLAVVFALVLVGGVVMRRRRTGADQPPARTSVSAS